MHRSRSRLVSRCLLAALLVSAGACTTTEEPPPGATVAALQSFLVIAGDGQATLRWEFAEGETPAGVVIVWGSPEEVARFVEAPSAELPYIELPYIELPYIETETTITDLTNGQPYGFAAEVQGGEGRRSERTLMQVGYPNPPDEVPPTLVATTPTDGATDVPLDNLLSVTFSEPMAASSVSLTLTPDRDLGTLHWNEDLTELVASPVVPWHEGETYEVKVAGGDMAGNPLSGVDVFAFTTGYERLAPTVMGHSPESGLMGAPTNTRVTVTFGEPMVPLATSRALRIEPSVPMTYGNDETQQTFTWTPRAPLDPGTTYTVTLGAGAQSVRGNALGEDFVFDFTTSLSGPDETAPRVGSFLPEDDAAGLERHYELAIAFSEAMDQAWTQAALVFPSHPGLTGTYTWTNSGTVMRFVPDEDPAFGELVSWQLLGQAKDLAGNSIGADTASSFRILRLETATIFSDPSIDGEVAILPEPTEWGDHRVDTSDASLRAGKINYTYLGLSPQRAFYSFDLSPLPEDLTRIHHAVVDFVESGVYPVDCSVFGFAHFESVPIGPALTVDDFDVAPLSFYHCNAEGEDCASRPFAIEVPCYEWWNAGLFSFATAVKWTATTTQAVQNDWDDRAARQHLSQWRIRLDTEDSSDTQYRRFLSNHWQVETDRRPTMIVEYLIP